MHVASLIASASLGNYVSVDTAGISVMTKHIITKDIKALNKHYSLLSQTAARGFRVHLTYKKFYIDL